jgi:hypothetical protein
MIETLIILKYDSYANARDWLKLWRGVVIAGESVYGEVSRCKVYFSGLMISAEISYLLEFLPGAIHVDPIKFPHLEEGLHLYSVPQTRDSIIKTFRSIGATIQISPCCLDLPSFEEASERIQELTIRFGQPLSQVPTSKISKLYNNIY